MEGTPKTPILNLSFSGVRGNSPTSTPMPISMVDGAPRPRGLLDQPNEVLHMIIGFLPDVRFVNFVDEGGIKRNVSQYLVLAQVCQQLRRVVLAANFWQDPEFCFSDLVKGRALDGTDSSRPLDTKTIKVGGLIKALLEDENLLNSLKRKKSWTFDNVESLLIVVMSGAWLTESIEDIRLELKEWEQIPALKCLGFCGKIKRLDICDDSEDCKSVFDLDLISNCLPNIEKLIIDFNRHKGSLEDLGNLTELTLAHSHGLVEIRRERWSDLLPVSSRWTLRRLTIDKVYSVTDVLDNFSNLTHFTLFEPLNGNTVTTFKKLTNVTLY